VAAHEDVVEHGEVREQLDVLEGAGDAERGDPVGPHAHDRLALPADVALLGLVHLVDAVEDGRLPGAVGADDGEQLAGVDGEADVVEGGDAPEGEPDRVELEQGLRHDNHRFLRL
jgi:hypothetical protein